MTTDRKQVHVKPAPGRVVLDPERGDELPAAGRLVARSTYWVRRIQDNDVIASEPPAPANTAKAVKATVADKGAK